MTDVPKLPRAITQILNDRESGSVGLLDQLIAAFEEQLQDPELQAEDLRYQVDTVRASYRHFAAIENFLASLTAYLGPASAFPSETVDFISDYKSYWKDAPGKIAGHFLRIYNPEHKTILTHSQSQTVISLLDQLHLRQISFEVIQTLSVPGEEGKIAHERMLQMGLRSRLVHEDKLKDVLYQTDLVLIGCDTLLGKEFLNKSGTSSILEQAKQFNLPSFLLAETRKKINSPSWKNEMTGHKLFEWVPLNLVSALLTESPE